MFFKNKPKYKPIDDLEVKKLGIKKEYEGFFNTLEDLAKFPPNLVTAECLVTVQFMNHGSGQMQTMIKNKKYVMATALYQMLYFDTRINKRILRPINEKFLEIFKPYKGEDLTNKTLLVSRTGGIGDLLFIQPNLIYLKEKYPSCKINISCAPQYHSMIKNWDCIDEIYSIPTDIVYYRRANYHAIFEGVIERCKEAESINAYELFTKWMGINLPKDKLIPKQNPIISENVEKLVLPEDYKKFILVQMRASSPIRTPRPEIFKKIIDKITNLGINVVLTDMNKKQNEIDYFISTLENKDKVFNFAKYSNKISDTIAITSWSKMVIAVDSALPHIAASLGIPIFGIFGPFPGEVRLSTYPNCEWYNALDKCTPCFKHGMNVCRNSKDGYPICFDDMDIDYIITRIKDMYYDKGVFNCKEQTCNNC